PCFITTATIECVRDKCDNNYELNLFRWYRDNWLANQIGGKEIIKRYYEIAPEIVKEINKDRDSSKIYTEIWDKYLSVCKNKIECKEYEEAKRIYIEMVENLADRYIYRRG
ncbi:MAG: CFI-box-CTERM domain-containing protein, partial [Myxococcota bacterium]